MKKGWNFFGALVLIALVSSGVSFATFNYLNDSISRKNAVPESGSSGDLVHRTMGRAMGMAAYEQDFTTVADNSVHAVVHIKSTVMTQGRTYVDPFQFFFGGGRSFQEAPRKQEGFGSGVIITKDGYIVTNNHVIDQASEIQVTLNDKRIFKAELIGKDPTTDLALLKIKGDDFPFLPFGSSDELKVGEWVLAVGNPFNLTSTVTAGIVSAKARNLEAMMSASGGARIESFIQTDAAVNPGNSGGALVNTRGELVGINTAITSETGNFAGHSFAIPTTIVSKVIDDLKNYGMVQRAFLGIAYNNITQELQKEKDLETLNGIYVTSVENRSAALEAGIEVGDVLVAVNGAKTDNSSQFIEQLNRFRPGDEITIDLLRKGKQMSVKVTLKNKQGTTDVVKQENGKDMLGAKFEALTDKEKNKYRINYGVRVESLKEGKLKAVGVMKDFIILKVNNKPVSTPEELDAIVNSIIQDGTGYGEHAMFIIGMKPDGHAGYLAIDLSEE